MQQVANLDRNSMLIKKNFQKKNDTFNRSLITDYSTQHYRGKNVLKKHWPIPKKYYPKWGASGTPYDGL